MTIYSKIYSSLNQVMPEDVNTFDWYNDQYLNIEDDVATGYPAVYLELPDNLAWRELGDKMQAAENARIRLHVIVFTLNDERTELFDLIQTITTSINHHAIIESVTNELNEVIGENHLSTELVRSATSYRSRSKALKIGIVEFVTNLTELSLMDNYFEASDVRLVLSTNFT